MNKNEFLQRLKEDLSSLTEEERLNALKYYEEYFADANDMDVGDNQEEKILSEFISPENLADKIKGELGELNDKIKIELGELNNRIGTSEINNINEITEKEEDKKEQNNHNEQDKENMELKIDFNNYTYDNISRNYNDSTVQNNQNAQNNHNDKNDKNNYSYNKNDKQNNNTLKFVLLFCTAPIWLPFVIALASVAFGLFMAVLGISFAVAAIAISGFVMIGGGFFSIGYGISMLFVDFMSAFYPIGAGLIVSGLGMIIAYFFTKLTVGMFKTQFKAAGSVIRGIVNKFSRQAA